ncbi:mitochondrial ubiquitin ligase activator of NFKB 1-like isoform X3 [Symsagittifera roscoffensis]|uniref:mitochondrial ubiquitin ligase activator of NFKB 1-like isoform X3 n=1 Tax=Symsagittifera roscoffensis TaxID=84072 RepID=UPI00307B88EC
MEFDVDWAVIGGCLVCSCVIGILQRSTANVLQHIQSAQPVSDLKGLENGQLISVDLGSVGKKQNLKSSNNINVVALSKIVKEHKVVFNTALSLWIDRDRIISSDFQSVPFNLKCYAANNKEVKLTVEPQNESVFSGVLQQINSSIQYYDQASVSDRVLDYLSGEKTKAFQTIERGLAEGSRVTAIGYTSEIRPANFISSSKWKIDGDSSGRGVSLILSSYSVAELISKEQRKIWYYQIAQGITIAILVGFGLKIAKEQFDKYRFGRTLQRLRAEARRIGGGGDRSQADHVIAGVDPDPGSDDPDQPCVICLEARRETFFVPCGHVCACTNCANLLTGASSNGRRCPICRQSFTQINYLRYP